MIEMKCALPTSTMNFNGSLNGPMQSYSAIESERRDIDPVKFPKYPAYRSNRISCSIPKPNDEEVHFSSFSMPVNVNP
jgi:hypothetical protein